eukprot:scaffold803_cov310-Pinguiococcus_pyrenoidosus.AAC.216
MSLSFPSGTHDFVAAAHPESHSASQPELAPGACASTRRRPRHLPPTPVQTISGTPRAFCRRSSEPRDTGGFQLRPQKTSSVGARTTQSVPSWQAVVWPAASRRSSAWQSRAPCTAWRAPRAPKALACKFSCLGGCKTAADGR